MMQPLPDIRCVNLKDATFAAPILRDLFLRQWQPYYGPDGPGDADADLQACLTAVELPAALVALDAAERVLGTAALKTDSVGAELGVGPWLAALLVAPDRRNRGIGSALVAAIEAEAWARGYGALYCATDTAEKLLARRGWRPFGATQSLRGRLTVLCLTAPGR